MTDIFNYEHPFVCTDAAVFTIKTDVPGSYRKLPEPRLMISLYRRDTEPYVSKWCLPGGFLSIDEMPEENIRRKLFAKTDIGLCKMEQLYTFCDLERDPRARVISISYLGLMSESDSKLFGDKAEWFTVRPEAGRMPRIQKDGCELSPQDIGFDHRNIIKLALERLQSKILYTDMGFSLLPEEFTLTQLQNVYEVILGKKDQAANFRRKIMNMVQETERYAEDKGHRPAKLYRRREGGD